MASKNKKTNPTPEQIEKRLKTAQKNYKHTIQRFTDEKIRFIELYKQQGIIDQEDAIKEFEKKYFSDFSKDNKYENEQMEKLSEKLLVKLKDSLTDAIQNGNTQQLKQLKILAEQAGSSKNLQGNQEYEKIAEQLFSLKKIEEMVKEELDLLMQGTQGFPLDQFTDYALGLRRGIFYRLAVNPETTTYITSQSIHSVKGYFAEAAVYKVFSQLSEELSNSDIGFKVEAIGGKNIAQDFNFYFNIPSNLSVSGSAEIEPFYGQSKSWDRPEWIKKYDSTRSSDYTIGHKAELVEKVILKHKSAKHSWSMMVLGLSEDDNAYEAMDKAIIWRLGHEMIWADALMQSMIDSNRYLSTSFTAKDYTATNIVKWASRTKNT